MAIWCPDRLSTPKSSDHPMGRKRKQEVVVFFGRYYRTTKWEWLVIGVIAAAFALFLTVHFILSLAAGKQAPPPPQEPAGYKLSPQPPLDAGPPPKAYQ